MNRVDKAEKLPELTLGYIVVFERPVAGFDPSRRLEALALAANELDDLALMLDLPILAEFSHLEANLLREVMEELAEFTEAPELTQIPGFAEMLTDLGELSQEDLESEDWFDAEDGLRWVVSVRSYLERDSLSLSKLEGVTLEDIQSDLLRLEHTLERAHREGVRFHLELDL